MGIKKPPAQPKITLKAVRRFDAILLHCEDAVKLVFLLMCVSA